MSTTSGPRESRLLLSPRELKGQECDSCLVLLRRRGTIEIRVPGAIASGGSSPEGAE